MADEATLTIKIQDSPLTGTVTPPPRTIAPSLPDAVAPTAGKPPTAAPEGMDAGTAKPPISPSAAPPPPSPRSVFDDLFAWAKGEKDTLPQTGSATHLSGGPIYVSGGPIHLQNAGPPPMASPGSPPITLASPQPTAAPPITVASGGPQQPQSPQPPSIPRSLPVSQTSTAINRNVNNSAALPPGMMNSLNTAANVATAGAAMNARSFATSLASATALIPGFGSAISAASIAMLSLQGQVDSLASSYSAYNGQLALQVANQEMRDMFREMRRAQQMGPDVSRLYGKSTDFSNKMEQVLDNIAPALIAFTDKTLDALNGIASILGAMTDQTTTTGQTVAVIGTVLSASYQATEAIMSGGIIPLLRYIGRQNAEVAQIARDAADREANNNLVDNVLNIGRGLPQGAVGGGAFTATPAPRGPIFGQ